MSTRQEWDEFDLELFALDVVSEETLTVLERKVGLGGGGQWWIDPSQKPIELDANGQIDEGAILDVEAQVNAWFRATFEKDPEFCNQNYHLLNRLNELARLKGLVDEVALKNQDNKNTLEADSTQQLYHSTLSLSGCGEIPNGSISARKSGTLDVTRSFEGPLSEQSEGSADTFKLRNPYNHNEPKYRTPLPDIFNGDSYPSDPPPASSTGQLYSKNPMLSRPFAKLSGLPQLHKSQQPPSPHHFPTSATRKTGLPNSSTLTVPNTTDNPDMSLFNQNRRSKVLARTYSKESLDGLKLDNREPTKKPELSAKSHNSRYLPTPLTSSLPLSEPDSDVEASMSLDVSYDVNPLSKSLGDTELVIGLHRSGVKPNASYSSMRSSEVFQIAQLQESHLREHSGSRGKLNGSNSSLTGSLTGEDSQRNRSASVDVMANATHRISDAGFLRTSVDRNVVLRQSPGLIQNPQTGYKTENDYAVHSSQQRLTDPRRPPHTSAHDLTVPTRRLNVSYDLDPKESGANVLSNSHDVNSNTDLTVGNERKSSKSSLISDADAKRRAYTSQQTVVLRKKSAVDDALDTLDKCITEVKSPTDEQSDRLNSQQSFEKLEAQLAHTSSILRGDTTAEPNMAAPVDSVTTASVDSSNQLPSSVVSSDGLRTLPNPTDFSKSKTQMNFSDVRHRSPLSPPSEAAAAVSKKSMLPGLANAPTAASKIPSLSSRPSRLPAFSGTLPSVNSRSHSGPNNSPRLPMSQLAPKNPSVQSDLDLRHSATSLKSRSRPEASGSATRLARPRAFDVARVQINRSDTSPTRSVVNNRKVNQSAPKRSYRRT